LLTLLYILFILTCIVLVVSVLLQPGKADAGALFSSAISSTAFGPRGTQTLLAKITIGAAAAFMLLAIALSLPAFTGKTSVLQSTTEEESQATPTPTPQASPAASPAQPGAANTGVPENPAESNVQTAPPETPANGSNGGAQPAPGK